MLGPYNAMWIQVSFDISTLTKADVKRANRFRKDLLDLGFSRFQLSVYHYYVSSKQIADTVAKKIQKIVPPNGQISILFITDRQFGMSINYYGGQVVDIECPEQGLLFD